MDSKIRKLDIVFNHPKRAFWAGTKVSGHVVVHLNQPTKIFAISILLRGVGHVTWKKLGSSSTKNSSHHLEKSEAFFEERITLFGNEEDDQGIFVTAGMNSFEFEMGLSEFLPNSFVGEHGFVMYMSSASVLFENNHGRKEKVGTVGSGQFFVIGIADLNAHPPQLQMPSQTEGSTEAGCLCIGTGTVACLFKVSKTIFVPGEIAIIYAEITNSSDTLIKYTEVSFVQIVTYKAMQETRGLFKKYGEKTKIQRNTITAKGKGTIPAREVKFWKDIPFEIPPVPPTGLRGFKSIDVQYCLQFKAVAKCDTELKLSIDVSIGTIPLQIDVREGKMPAAPTSCEEGLSDHEIKCSEMMKKDDECYLSPAFVFYKPIAPLKHVMFQQSPEGTMTSNAMHYTTLSRK